MLTERENYIRTVRMTGPEWIPAQLNLSDALWNELREELDDVLARHPILYPNHEPHDWSTWQPRRRAGTTERDPWGVLWDFDYDGVEGQAIEHPLDDWAKFDGFEPPDPMKYTDRREMDWDEWHANVRAKKEQGKLTKAGLDHGYFLMRLWYLRGFENLMVDFATGEPRLRDLCEMVTRRNLARVEQFIHAGVDAVYFGEDLGTQTASIISPADFREWVLPYYRRMMAPVRQAGIIVDTHSDGYIMELADLLLEAGADVLNPQDLCNGIDAIEREIKGRCCIKLDVDRQKIIPFGTPEEIRALIEEETRRLGSPAGGLSFIVGVYPPTPPENVHALLSAFEEFRTYWWE
ncbi:MAG: uroporphyrinogen decarboxylase family protein [Planctomycetota bacterium]